MSEIIETELGQLYNMITFFQPMYNVLRQMVSTLMDDCLPLVTEIAHLTIAGFDTRPCPAGLDVVKLVIFNTYNMNTACTHTRQHVKLNIVRFCSVA